ncbi:MAG TPA: hypothetical protein DIT32_06940 [Peptococcaceae bacterium]|nr:hypothetical protein [Peptococcaceae bacterium]
MCPTHSFHHEGHDFPIKMIHPAAFKGYENNPLLSPHLLGPIGDGVRQGLIRHLFLIPGEEENAHSASRLRTLAGQVPADTVFILFGWAQGCFGDMELGIIDLTETKPLKILEGCCNKLRFEDPEPLRITELPRILDMGQLYDMDRVMEFISALADALNCTVKELPLTFILSGGEEETIGILEVLGYLCITNILLS